MAKWYVVYKGRVSGIHTEWSDCLDQVDKFSGNDYKGFTSKKVAKASYLAFLRRKNGMKNFIIFDLLIVIVFMLYFIVV